ncbi:MAG: GNAT family N-acetyltransferase [Caulobacteraceae bacterium]
MLAIYEAAFPASERRTAADLAAMLARPDYRMVVMEEAGAVTGFASVQALDEPAIAQLDYIATAPGLRNGGRGAALFAAAAELARGRPLLVEVDSDREDCADRALRARRKGFYARLGCRTIEGLDSRLGLDAAGPQPLMDLMVLGPLPGSADELRAWLVAVFVEVYGQAADDPRIDEMMATD